MMIEPGCQFASDNTAGVCPEAMNATIEANHGYASPYGEDAWTMRAAELVREIFEVDCDVFFAFNGTAANSLALASLCQSYHSVIAHELAHVETDECGGPEFFSNGTKLLLVGGDGGCVDVDVPGMSLQGPDPGSRSLSSITRRSFVWSRTAWRMSRRLALIRLIGSACSNSSTAQAPRSSKTMQNSSGLWRRALVSIRVSLPADTQ